VRFDNVEGNREEGVKNLQLVARDGLYFKAFAKILLGIIYLREKKPREAEKQLEELAHDYPSNPLFRKELAKISTQAGGGGSRN
jgi:predicted Zn-dependent protease